VTGAAVLDFGVCPPAGGFLRSRTYVDPRRTRRWSDAAGMEPAPSLLAGSMADFLAELDRAGVGQAVVRAHAMGARPRDSTGLPPLVVTTEEVLEIVRSQPGKLLAMPTIPFEDIPHARRLVPELAAERDLHGLVLHPHSWPLPVSAGDRAVMYPVYAICEELGLPLTLTIGGNAGPNLGYNAPVVVDQVAADFPSLELVIAHGDWPYVTEILHVAFRRENVYLCPDMYLFGMPGWRDYVDAANGFLQDRFIFASMHPYIPVTGAVEWCRSKLLPEVFPKVMGGNARRLLDL